MNLQQALVPLGLGLWAAGAQAAPTRDAIRVTLDGQTRIVRTLGRPTRANKPTSWGRTRLPVRITVSPAVNSRPRGATFVPAATGPGTRTRSVPVTSQRSIMTTASAPAGIGAPVMMRLAVPGPSATVGVRPAVISSTTVSPAGPAATSPLRTA